LSESTLTSVGSHSAWLTELPSHGPSRTFVTTDDGAHWRRLKLTNIESVVTVGNIVYAAKAHSLFAGTAEAGSLRWIGPSVGGQLAVAGETVYDYPTAYDVHRRSALRLIAITGTTITARAEPCRGFAAMNFAMSGSADGSVVAACASEPGAGEQVKRSFVSWDGGTTWRRSGAPSVIGYFGSTAAHSRAGTFIDTGRSRPAVSYDDGRTWQTVDIGAPAAADGDWKVGFDVSGQYGYALDSAAAWALYLSDDGGFTWRQAARVELPG
jgi:hypothetical protein